MVPMAVASGARVGRCLGLRRLEIHRAQAPDRAAYPSTEQSHRRSLYGDRAADSTGADPQVGAEMPKRDPPPQQARLLIVPRAGAPPLEKRFAPRAAAAVAPSRRRAPLPLRSAPLRRRPGCRYAAEGSRGSVGRSRAWARSQGPPPGRPSQPCTRGTEFGMPPCKHHAACTPRCANIYNITHTRTHTHARARTHTRMRARARKHT